MKKNRIMTSMSQRWNDKESEEEDLNVNRTMRFLKMIEWTQPQAKEKSFKGTEQWT